MGHDYYKVAVDHASEHAVLRAQIADMLDDHYVPWEGPGIDVEKSAGVWGWLTVKLDNGSVVVAGLHGEHRFSSFG